MFFVERYIAGLRPEIRTAAILHQLEDVDTASCLALLQEVELDNNKAGNSSKSSQRSFVKQSNNGDRNKHQSTPKEPRKVAEKLEALRAYRKAKNLCFKCGEPWARGHKCPDKVPLHIGEE